MCLVTKAASSSRLFSSNLLRGLVADSASVVMGMLRYSWLATPGTRVWRENQTSQMLACYEAAARAAGSAVMPAISLRSYGFRVACGPPRNLPQVPTVEGELTSSDVS
jgi:hypothetical protein